MKLSSLLLATTTLLSFNFALPSQAPRVALDAFGPQIAVAQTQDQLRLNLVGELKSIERNWRGEQRVVWRSLEGGFLRPAPKVRPGDIVRYTLRATNTTDSALSGVVLTDDLPANTTYVLSSASTVGGGRIDFSIDGGGSYTANPTIVVTRPDGTQEIVPAPAERYTHVRWRFPQAVPGKETVLGQYQVRIR